MMIGPLRDRAQAQSDGSVGAASLGLVGGLAAGSLVGLGISTAEARFFNRYMFGTDAAVRRLGLFSLAGAFAGFGLGAIDSAELGRIGKYAGLMGAAGLAAGALVGTALGISEGTFAGAYIGTGIGILAGVVVGALDTPSPDPSNLRSVPLGVRVTF